MTVTGCYTKDSSFITLYSGDVMYTIARGTGEWGSVRVGGTFANGRTFTKTDYERMKEECDNVGTFVLDRGDKIERNEKSGIMRECCGNCKYNKRDFSKPQGKGYIEFCCCNENSDEYGVPTLFDDTCDDFEEKDY